MVIDMTKENDPNIEDIVAVILNGRRVASPVLVNVKDGWVEVRVPKVPPVEEQSINQIMTDADKHSSAEDVAELQWETKRLTGKVFLLRKSTQKTNV